MEQDVCSANAAMAGELAPLARQKVTAVLNEGRALYNDTRSEAVAKKVQELDTNLARLEQLADERVRSGNERLRSEVSSLREWLQSTANPFMAANGDMGADLSTASHFVSVHKNFATDVINHDSRVLSVLNESRTLPEADRIQLQDFEREYENLKRTLEQRIQLGNTFEQVHRFARELEGSFESLRSLLDTNRDFANEKLAGQMTNVFQMIQETLSQERHQGEKFISSAKAASTHDHHLNVESAVDSVRKILVDHENRFTSVTEQWMSWQHSKVETKKLVHVVEEVQMWQEDVIEVIRILEGTKVTTVSETEGLQKRVNEIRNTLQQQEAKIHEAEKHTTSENKQFAEKVSFVRERQRAIEKRLDDLQHKVTTVQESLVVNEEKELVKAPEILAQLRDAQVDEGSRFEFAARIEGEPEPQITWHKDGIDVKQNMDYQTAFINGVATLTIEETFIEDSAIYTVRATNAGGTAESSARLTVKSRSRIAEEAKPRFVRQLQNVTVTEGETAILDCVIQGQPEPQVIWYKEEQTVKENDRIKLSFIGDRCSLTIERAQPSDTGLYTARARNQHGESTGFCQLKVVPGVAQRAPPPPTPPKPKLIRPQPPAFHPVLTNQVVHEGQSCTFQVTVSGEPLPQVQWKFNERPIQVDANVRIVEEASGVSKLVISRVEPYHAGMYMAVAENESGEARSGATLNVLPKVSGSSSIQQHNITSIISQYAHAPPAQQKSTFHQTQLEGFWSDSALTSTPTPPPIPKHRYQAEEFSENEVSEIGFSRTATEPEFIRPFLNEYTVNEGEKFRIECLMVGNPRPKVNWYFNDRNINTNRAFCEFSNIGDTYAIIFNPAKLDNAGYYKMTAENVRGRTESLTVLHVRPQSLLQRQGSGRSTGREHEIRIVDSQRKTPVTPANRQHQHVTEEFGMIEYEQRRPAHRDHSNSRLVTPPPTKKALHQQQQELLEQYDLDERKSTGHPPHFTQTLVSAVTADGDSAKFEGVVTGWPAPEVQWTKDGEQITRATHPKLGFSNIGGRVSLTFPNASLPDAGKYMCTARNASGVATSSAQLVVRPKTVAPDFIQRLISEEVVEGEQLKWSVRITGDPPPKVTWLRDGQVIPDCDEVRLLDEGNGVHSLVIVKVEAADCGQFTCLAENLAGEARSTADLVVRPQGTAPGNYFHVTKVTQEKQVKGEEVTRNQAFSIENPHG